MTKEAPLLSYKVPFFAQVWIRAVIGLATLVGVVFGYMAIAHPDSINGGRPPFPVLLIPAVIVAVGYRVATVSVVVYQDRLVVRNHFQTTTVRRDEIEAISFERDGIHRLVVIALSGGRRVVPDVVRSNRFVAWPRTEPVARELGAWLAVVCDAR